MGPMFTATSADIMWMAIVTLTAMLTRTASHISDRIRFFVFLPCAVYTPCGRFHLVLRRCSEEPAVVK